MSPNPQVTPATILRLTKNSPSPRTGVGQKSSAVELIADPRLTGAPKGASVLTRWASQMSRLRTPGDDSMLPGRFEAMYRLRPSGDSIGQPSTAVVFRSAWLPAISSIFCAVLHGEKGPADAASAAPEATAATSVTTSARLSMLIASPFLKVRCAAHMNTVLGWRTWLENRRIVSALAARPSIRRHDPSEASSLTS